MVQEPSFTFQNIAIWVLPYLAYLFGIFIRKKAIPGPGSPPLADQLWLGIPMALVIVSPFVVVLRAAMSADVPGISLTSD
jgi:cytochrome c-type biogenesis protein CcmH/NrfF